MSPKQKYHQNWNVTKTEMSLKPKIQETKCTKTKILPWLKFLLNLNVTKTEMLQKLKFCQNWNGTKMKFDQKFMLLQLKCLQSETITKADIPPKLKFHQH